MTIAHCELDFSLPAGFLWGSAEAAIKKPGRLDVGLLYTNLPCSIAGVFTQNRFCAAPVKYSQHLLQKEMLRGVVVNAGCANAGTGMAGYSNAERMSGIASDSCGGGMNEFLVCSTGTIGTQLPMDRVEAAIRSAARNSSSEREAFHNFAKSILTTDTVEKIAWAEFKSEGKTVRIVGCAKGSGMMCPNMATLLSFVMTDAAVPVDVLQASLERAVASTLNCMTVDGDTSTNDTLLLFSNGASGVEISGGPLQQEFDLHLTRVLTSLTKQLARDGEGATKLIEVKVTEARDFSQARTVGLAIANSNLVKTAIYGRDANWGRILCAAGYSGVEIRPELVSVKLGPLTLFLQGEPQPLDEEAATQVLSSEFVPIEVAIGLGDQSATVWTCDLTEKYIEINGAYRT
jgi:glutamate N-acetyltransferase/amino-acid N-acetyltransferase